MENYNVGYSEDGLINCVSNTGAWSFQQNLSYAIFIDIHKKLLTSKKKMRQMQFFNKLSLFVATRTPAQCRSHHQKVLAKFKYISKITVIFKTQLGIIIYKSLLKQGLENIQRIQEQLTQKDTQLQPNSFQPSPLLQKPFQPRQMPLKSVERAQEGIQWAASSNRFVDGVNGSFLWLYFGEGAWPCLLINYIM